MFPGCNQLAQSAYNGQEYTASLITGYDFNVQGLTIMPLASLHYTTSIGGCNEWGGSDINLAVHSQSYNFPAVGLGLKLAHPFAVEGGALIPSVHAKWLYMLNNPTLQATASFASAGTSAFTTPGLSTSGSMFNVGMGLTSCHVVARRRLGRWKASTTSMPDRTATPRMPRMIRFTSRF